jgi:putative ABC transport system permease protein
MNSFLLHGTFFTGLTLALLLALAKRDERKANLFLSAALMVIVIKTGGFTPLLLPALGPLVFFYIRSLTDPERRFQWKDGLHFSPLLVGVCIPGWMEWIALAGVLAYLYVCHRLINDYYRRQRMVMMDRPRLAFRSIERALVLLGTACVCCVFGEVFYLLPAFILIVSVGIVVLNEKGIVAETTPMTDKWEAKEKGRRLKALVAENRFYEDAELTLSALATKLGISTHDLSRIINLGLDQNFNDFINELRVREVVRKMQDPKYDQITLMGIAYDCGFNSKTTFNRVFKEMTGKTPLEYKKDLKKEVPGDSLAPRPRIRPVILRADSLPNRGAETSKRNYMFRNYLKIAYRQFLKQKMYAFIKIGGFALGIAACLLIGLYIREETNFDRSYPDADRIYRLEGNGSFNRGYAWPAPMARFIESDFQEVAAAGHIAFNMGIQLSGEDQSQGDHKQYAIYADQSLFDIFKLPMVAGDGRKALTEPQTIVITQTLANKYFHRQDPIGQVMYIDNDKAHPYRVSGVMADIPATSHLKPFDYFLTLAGKELWPGESTDWGSSNHEVYIKLKKGVDADAFEKKLNAVLIKTHFPPDPVKDGKDTRTTHFHLQPVMDINLYSADMPDGFEHGDIRFIWLFSAIAILILVIACINFINLSTAKSANRAKEVGLRKAVGSNRRSLIYQFLTESIIYSLVSFILGLLCAWLLLPFFNALASKSLVMPWNEWWLIPVILVAAIIVGAVAGLYPAFYLSGFLPARVLKGAVSGGSRSPLLRNGLVVFQFVASIVLIIGTIVIYDQTYFILHRNVGFDKEQVMVLRGTNIMGDQKLKAFRDELKGLASVRSVSISDYLPIPFTHRNGNVFWNEGRQAIDQSVWGQHWQVDDAYFKTMGIKLVEGRNFSPDMADDTTGVSTIINQTMAKKLNLKDPIGKSITNGNLYRIIGVVQDFNAESMRGGIDPMIFRYGLSNTMMTIKFSGGSVEHGVAEVSALWKKFSPDQPIRYTFLDQDFATMYADVVRTGGIFNSFAILAITIACLGLFALSAFMAEQRSKEIGIRKVLGASTESITALLSLDFVKLVLLAILIASPLAWWGMDKWLQDFAYKIDISWWMFAVAGLMAIFIALVTVSFQSVRAALADPVKSLKSE